MLDEVGKRIIELVKDGNSFFITGKAGTGKTELLKEVALSLKKLDKKVAVTASTGVAANHAGGVTLHSLLRIPLSPFVPGIKNKELYKLKEAEKIVVLSLDTLIIDEVSMIRCDVMDAVDNILRHYRRSSLPFGGLQVILFGDLYQLMPVAKSDDIEKLSPIYESMYFFSSKVMKSWSCPIIELKHVYRQDNPGFVELLNHIREGNLSNTEEKRLEKLICPNFRYPKPNDYITLTTHKWIADKRNHNELVSIKGRGREYKAYIDGCFPRDDRPTNYVLHLKVGARVMFVKNDKDEQIYNGKLGTVEKLYDDSVAVRTDDDHNLILVERQRWDYQRYFINKKTNEMEIETLGSYVQLPLKLAWAITIHKSQGLTFEKVVIDAGKAFAAGQVYVALSRCRSFDKIVLLSKITKKLVMIDESVNNYLSSAERVDVDKMVSNPQTYIKQFEGFSSKVPTSYAKTLKLLGKGYYRQEVAQKRRLAMSTVIDHICFFIERGQLSAEKFIHEKELLLINKVIEDVGWEKLSKIKKKCPDNISYDEIKMVVADRKRQEFERELDIADSNNPETDDDFQWYFVDSVPFTKSSKYFLSSDCRVVLSELGYYLEVGDEYIKLRDYPSGFRFDKGNIWIKKPIDKRGYRMAHDIQSDYFLIGYIREEESRIVFTKPDGEEYIITLE